MLKWILDRPFVVFFLAILISAAGILSAFTLPIKLQPNKKRRF